MAKANATKRFGGKVDPSKFGGRSTKLPEFKPSPKQKLAAAKQNVSNKLAAAKSKIAGKKGK